MKDKAELLKKQLHTKLGEADYCLEGYLTMACVLSCLEGSRITLRRRDLDKLRTMKPQALVDYKDFIKVIQLVPYQSSSGSEGKKETKYKWILLGLPRLKPSVQSSKVNGATTDKPKEVSTKKISISPLAASMDGSLRSRSVSKNIIDPYHKMPQEESLDADISLRHRSQSYYQNSSAPVANLQSRRLTLNGSMLVNSRSETLGSESSNRQSTLPQIRASGSMNLSSLTAKCHQIVLKLEEKFKSFAESFRFFDVHHTGKINEKDWNVGLVHLNAQLDPIAMREVFIFLDRAGDGTVNFKEFSLLKSDFAGSQQRYKARSPNPRKISRISPGATRTKGLEDLLKVRKRLVLPSWNDPSFTYGKKAPAKDRIKDLISYDYQKDWIVDDAIHYTRKRVHEKQLRDNSRSSQTVTSKRREELARIITESPDVPNRRWKLKKFDGAPSRVALNCSYISPMKVARSDLNRSLRSPSASQLS